MHTKLSAPPAEAQTLSRRRHSSSTRHPGLLPGLLTSQIDMYACVHLPPAVFPGRFDNDKTWVPWVLSSHASLFVSLTPSKGPVSRSFSVTFLQCLNPRHSPANACSSKRAVLSVDALPQPATALVDVAPGSTAFLRHSFCPSPAAATWGWTPLVPRGPPPTPTASHRGYSETFLVLPTGIVRAGGARCWRPSLLASRPPVSLPLPSPFLALPCP